MVCCPTANWQNNVLFCLPSSSNQADVVLSYLLSLLYMFICIAVKTLCFMYKKSWSSNLKKNNKYVLCRSCTHHTYSCCHDRPTVVCLSVCPFVVRSTFDYHSHCLWWSALVRCMGLKVVPSYSCGTLPIQFFRHFFCRMHRLARKHSECRYSQRSWEETQRSDKTLTGIKSRLQFETEKAEEA